jgi:hypothetical protein
MPELSWPVLQKCALDSAHPAWFMPIDDVMLAEARREPATRRLLAMQLRASSAPILFGSFPAVLPHALNRAHWMLLPRDRLEALALDLGSQVFAPAIRRCIERQAVLRLRRVLGAQRYGEILRQSLHDVDLDDAHQVSFQRALFSDEALSELLNRAGWREWFAYASSMHPAAVECVRLLAAPEEVIDCESAMLGSDRVQTLLSAAVRAHEESAHD